MHPNAKKIQFTPAGFVALKKEHDELLAKRPAAVAELKRAREMGDLSENGAYKGARSLLNQIDSRLRYLSNLIRFANVVESTQKDIVGLGSQVVIHDGKNTQTYQIVGEHEANSQIGKISHKSPLGSQLMGKKKGETVKLHLPSGEIAYTIENISS